jgi:hypothetical protein
MTPLEYAISVMFASSVASHLAELVHVLTVHRARWTATQMQALSAQNARSAALVPLQVARF